MLYIVCHNCGYVLYKATNSIRTPREIISYFGYRCPRCLAKLSEKPKYVIVVRSGGVQHKQT